MNQNTTTQSESEPKITEEDFKEYERVRQSGRTNMMNTSNVADLSTLTEAQAKEIVLNYSNYNQKFPEVRE